MNTKCVVVDGNKVDPCVDFASACDISPTKRSRGLFGLTLVDLKHRMENKGTDRMRNAFAIKSGEFVDRGIFVRFCPFCGENIETKMPEFAE